MLQRHTVSNKCCSFEPFIHQRILKKNVLLLSSKILRNSFGISDNSDNASLLNISKFFKKEEQILP